MQRALVQFQAEAGKLRRCKSFVDIHRCIQSVCENIRGLGSLYVYDTALRIGAYLDLMPDRVYLQAGALEGACALGIGLKDSPLPVDRFPEPLQALAAHEIEDLLCIYKDHLAGIRS